MLTILASAGWIAMLFMLLFIWMALASIADHLFALRKIAEERHRLNKF